MYQIIHHYEDWGERAVHEVIRNNIKTREEAVKLYNKLAEHGYNITMNEVRDVEA